MLDRTHYLWVSEPYQLHSPLRSNHLLSVYPMHCGTCLSSCTTASLLLLPLVSLLLVLQFTHKLWTCHSVCGLQIYVYGLSHTHTRTHTHTHTHLHTHIPIINIWVLFSICIKSEYLHLAFLKRLALITVVQGFNPALISAKTLCILLWKAIFIIILSISIIT